MPNRNRCCHSSAIFAPLSGPAGSKWGRKYAAALAQAAPPPSGHHPRCGLVLPPVHSQPPQCRGDASQRGVGLTLQGRVRLRQWRGSSRRLNQAAEPETRHEPHRPRRRLCPDRHPRHARCVLDAWRRDYNETRPHSKLGWLTPKACAQALTGQIGRPAALVDGCAGRPIATPTNHGSDHPGTLVMAG